MTIRPRQTGPDEAEALALYVDDIGLEALDLVDLDPEASDEVERLHTLPALGARLHGDATPPMPPR